MARRRSSRHSSSEFPTTYYPPVSSHRFRLLVDVDLEYIYVSVLFVCLEREGRMDGMGNGRIDVRSVIDPTNCKEFVRHTQPYCCQ